MDKYPALKPDEDNLVTVNNPNEWPLESDCEAFYEPMVKGTIIVPEIYMPGVTGLVSDARGIQDSLVFIDQHRIRIEFTVPLAEVITKFFDRLKSVTSGWCNFL